MCVQRSRGGTKDWSGSGTKAEGRPTEVRLWAGPAAPSRFLSWHFCPFIQRAFSHSVHPGCLWLLYNTFYIIQFCSFLEIVLLWDCQDSWVSEGMWLRFDKTECFHTDDYHSAIKENEVDLCILIRKEDFHMLCLRKEIRPSCPPK